MPANPNYDEILSTTLANYRRTLEDNVFTARPLLNWLQSRNRVESKDGGAKIVVPLIHALNSTAKPYFGYDQLDLTAQAGISAAEFPWRQFAASVAISGYEEAVNNGRSEVISLLQGKVMQTEESIAENLNQMFYGDGTTYQGVANAKAWLGLEALVGTTTLAGIDPSVAGNEFWKSVVLAADEDAGGPDTTVRSDSQWTRAYNTASVGGDQPRFVITTQLLFEHYEAGLAPQLRFTSNNEADARFQNLAFKGVPVFFDVHCPTGLTYFLNDKYLKLTTHSDRWMKSTGFRYLPDKDARWSNILLMGNLVISNRARQAKITGQTVV